MVFMRRNSDESLRSLEREYESERSLGAAVRLASARRRAGFSGAQDALALLMSDAAELGERSRGHEGEPPVPVRPATASFLTEMTRFMFCELLVRPRLVNPPFDLRRSVLAPTLRDGLLAWSTGLGNVHGRTRGNASFALRRVVDTEWSRDPAVDPRFTADGMFPLALVVHDSENSSVVVGLGFSGVISQDPGDVWFSLNDERERIEERLETEIEDRRAYRTALARELERIYLRWARPLDNDGQSWVARDRVAIHEADAIAFAMEPPA